MSSPAVAPAVRAAGEPRAAARPARRRLLGLGLLAVLLLVAVVASLAVGSRALPPADVWSALTAPTGTEADVVVRELRLPRTLLGVAVGIALGLAGALAQAHTRNPVADPGLLGVSAGAALAVVAGITVAGGERPLLSVGLALAGALVAGVVVFAVGAAAGGTPLTLVLAGVAVTALLTAVTSALVLMDAGTLDAYRFWSAGSVAGRGPDVLVTVAPFLAAGAALALVQGPALNALHLGDDVARGLGLHVGRTRLAGVLSVTLLTGAAVAACGPIAFLGLVVPHVARAVTGPDHRWLLPVSGLAGAVLLLAADVAGRVVSRPGELQVGIALALVGAPAFVLLVRRRRLVAA